MLIIVNEEQIRELAFSLARNEKLLWQPEHHSYAARNLGIQAARGSIIALTDSDTVPDSRWIEAGVTEILRGADLVAGHIDLSFQRIPLTPSGSYEKYFGFDQAWNAKRGRSVTANLFARKTLFEDYSLFNNTSLTGEDFEWTSRVTGSGAFLVYSLDARVTHPARETLREILLKSERTIRLISHQPSLRSGVAIAVRRFANSSRMKQIDQDMNSNIVREILLAHTLRVILRMYAIGKLMQILFQSRRSPNNRKSLV